MHIKCEIEIEKWALITSSAGQMQLSKTAHDTTNTSHGFYCHELDFNPVLPKHKHQNLKKKKQTKLLQLIFSFSQAHFEGYT